jgi:hypothetical protein
MSDKKIRIVLQSKLKLFMGGLRKVLEFETGLTVVTETSGIRELNASIK